MFALGEGGGWPGWFTKVLFAFECHHIGLWDVRLLPA